MIEEEMRTMVDDDPELALEELMALGSLKKMAVLPNEEEEILGRHELCRQRRFMEVSENWEDGLPAIKREVESLLREKEAFREVFPEELKRLQQEAGEKGKV
jgi:hypothetical protein